MFEQDQLRRATQLMDLCRQRGQEVVGLSHKGLPVDGGKLLLSLAGLESNFGALREFVRSEPAYSPGGRYYNADVDLRQLYRRYGVLATASFGTFQIMYKTAHELGFKGHPIQLQEDLTCSYWATRLIVDRFQKRFGAKTLKDILDAYNSGNHKDANVPESYVKKGIEFYENLPSM